MTRRDTDTRHFHVTVVNTYYETYWVEGRDEDEAFERATEASGRAHRPGVPPDARTGRVL